MDAVIDVLFAALLTGAIITILFWIYLTCIPKSLTEFLDELEQFLEDHQNKENN
jgi:hypothetical protein